MPQRFDVIVFDWDGTLLDSTTGIAECIQEAARALGLPVPSDDRAKHVIGLGLKDALEHAVPDLRPEDYQRFIAAYRTEFLARDATMPLFAGTREMLSGLRTAGHALAIATGKSHAGLMRSLEGTQLTGVFHATRTADKTASKPHPQMLLELMEELAVAPDRVLMIGDTTHDLRMAESAGVAALGVTFGAHPRAELERAARLALMDSTRELHDWLTRNA